MTPWSVPDGGYPTVEPCTFTMQNHISIIIEICLSRKISFAGVCGGLIVRTVNTIYDPHKASWSFALEPLPARHIPRSIPLDYQTGDPSEVVHVARQDGEPQALGSYPDEEIHHGNGRPCSE